MRAGGLHEFVRRFWHKVDPAHPFVDNWHIGAVCEHLQAVHDHQIKRLVINQPPGTSKSTIVSVNFPAWEWTINPNHKFMFCSYSDSVVERDARRQLNVVQCAEYQQCWPTDLNSKKVKEITTAAGGLRFSTTLHGQATGWHVNTQCVDDPSKPKDAAAKTKTELVKVSDLWADTFSNRRAEPVSEFARIVMMQRLHDLDLAGRCLDEGYEHLCLPMRYEPRCQWDRGSSLNVDQSMDPRTEPGELLFPARYNEETVDNLEQELGTPSQVSAQEQQNPTPETGSYITREWLEEPDRRYSELPAGSQFLVFRQYWDLALDGSQESHSRVAGLLMAYWREKHYIVDLRVGHYNYPETKALFEATQKEGFWGLSQRIKIENKALGPALMQEMRGVKGLPCKLEPHEPQGGSKADRLSLQSDKIEKGLLLTPSWQPWVASYIDELVKFPNAKHDDLVDVTTMMLEDCASRGKMDPEALRRAAARQAHRAGQRR